MIAVQIRPRGQLRRIQAGVRLGHAKARLVLARDQGRQHARFLRLVAMNDHRIETEDIDVNGARAAHGRAGFGDRADHHRRLGNAKAGAAIGFRHGDTQPVTFGHGVKEGVREDGVAVALHPVVVVELRADAQDLFANLRLGVGRGEIHGGLSGRVRRLWQPARAVV